MWMHRLVYTFIAPYYERLYKLRMCKYGTDDDDDDDDFVCLI